MQSFFYRAALLSCIALFFAACAGTSTVRGASDMRELQRLPLESKFYFRNGISIPARAEQVWLVSEPGVTAALSIPPSEKDRILDSTTPLLLDRIENPRKAGSCAVNLYLSSPGGVSATLRASRTGSASRCMPVTIRDLEAAALVVVSPPVPIQ